MSAVAQNLARVREAIARAAERAGRPAETIRLVAVSKTKPVELIREAVAAGQLEFGENYAQELRDKMQAIEIPGIQWHFIGRLQRNKVKYVVGRTALIHSVDSVPLAEELEARSARVGVITRVLIEVNIGGEASKSGVAPEALAELATAVRRKEHLELAGLMTMPPFHPDPEMSRPYYRQLRELRNRMRETLGEAEALPELSMGLSHDFEVAIEEGATLVRIGTAIFGAREKE